jgi:hypothetical protein
MLIPEKFHIWTVKIIMRRNKYNLIEIALSIAILAIGLTAIVSLFPVGFQEMRDSIGENYSTETADSMFAFIAREAYDEDTWNYLFVTGGGAIPSSKPSTVLTSSTGWTQLEGDIYNPNAGDGVYGLKVTSDEGNNIDFTGEVLLWKSEIKNIRVSGEDINELEYNYAVALHLEISWPVEKPYAQRKKNIYYFELFNYNYED